MELLEDIPLSHEQAALIARGLYTLSCVDGHEEREGMLIRSFWVDTVGAGSVLDLKAFDTMPAVTHEDLKRGLKAPKLRQMFLKTAVLLSYADGKATDDEKAWLKDAATALDIDDAELQRTDELVRTYLLSQLSHLQNTEALTEVAKELGFGR